jgi:hypothetical protein
MKNHITYSIKRLIRKIWFISWRALVVLFVVSAILITTDYYYKYYDFTYLKS